MDILHFTVTLFFTFLSETSSLHVLNESSLKCALQDIPCTPEINKCFYKEWLKEKKYTPTAPLDLKVHWDVKMDEKGDLFPVIVARWKASDDGSIQYLKGAEFQVTKSGIGEHLCIHYKFLWKHPDMRNPNGEQWAFLVDQMAVDPGFTYFVSVSNLPKPNSGHTNYNISQTVVLPDCKDPIMQRTKICIETGAFWQPNITKERTGLDGRTLLISFKTVELCKDYTVFLSCGGDKQIKPIHNENQRSLLNVTFDLEAWPRTCCNFNVKIQPFFYKCGNDCIRRSHDFSICPELPVPSKEPPIWLIFAGLFLLICGIAVCAAFLCCRKQQEDPTKNSTGNTDEEILPVPAAERSVLIIYSRDHPLYTDIVLKLSAFLRAKCGVEVYLDLLDTTSIGVVGRLPWTEQQKRLIEQTSNKVLVLCSRGVQAKWGAMCGESRVHLREDVCSPMGDMLTLALQLITPDMHRPASFGKYLVAYFEDICDERDVPSIFQVAVTYKLMKHFEELYFRVLDLKKYQREKIHTIEGIGIDEYFNCDSGKALKDAIEVFQAYQLQNPDWFEKECLESEDEEVTVETPFLDLDIQPIRTNEPVLNCGPPVFEHGVEIHCEDEAGKVWVSEVQPSNMDFAEPSLLGIQPVHSQVYSLVPSVEPPPGILTSDVYPAVLECHPCIMAEPALQELLPPDRNEVFVMAELPAEDPSVEDDTDALQQLLHLQLSLASFQVPAPPPSMNDFNQPEETGEREMEEASRNRQSRYSDQGYSSRDSVVREEPSPSSPAGQVKLQEVLHLNSPISSGFCTETMES